MFGNHVIGTVKPAATRSKPTRSATGFGSSRGGGLFGNSNQSTGPPTGVVGLFGNNNNNNSSAAPTNTNRPSGGTLWTTSNTASNSQPADSNNNSDTHNNSEAYNNSNNNNKDDPIPKSSFSTCIH